MVGRHGYTFLILDNTPTFFLVHLKGKQNVHAIFLQPMDQGVMKCTKRHFRWQYLRNLLLEDENEQGTTAYNKKKRHKGLLLHKIIKFGRDHKIKENLDKFVEIS